MAGRKAGADASSSRKPEIAIDIAIEAGEWPTKRRLKSLVGKAVGAATLEAGGSSCQPSELSVVFSDDAHIKVLNAGWRGKDKPTNVLSFPAFPVKPGDPLPPMLGDIVLAAETV